MVKRIFTAREIAEAGIAIGLAFVLSMIKVYHLPAGGSVTAGSMIPILLLALRRGYRLGLVTAVLYGVVQFIEGPYVVHPIQVLLDYPLAFGALGLAGFFAVKAESSRSSFYPFLGIATGIAGRFVCHFFSGAIFYAESAPPGMSPWIFSALYNASYLIPELIVSSVLMYLLIRKGVLELYR
ncbi:MAG: energy-coupled thiamine transporter ThiT [Theionarchaea archaeon]|nr:energy-coupled thiamine transporter ThiT [Theionarchaea archaeon]